MADLNQIKIVLVKKKRTGKWLAEQLGKSTCTISKWCSNTTQPDIPTLARIAKLLEVNVKDLLNDSEQ
ncbi:MAG: helix-turn-helix transcriptional regulator [Victivallales bacterium]|nr:helix-turn-helix transcriptional regulator [Victivallales bacterium]